MSDFSRLKIAVSELFKRYLNLELVRRISGKETPRRGRISAANRAEAAV